MEMNICSKCGVELEEDYKSCPLCGRNIGSVHFDEKPVGSVPSDVINSHRKERKKYLWELAGIIAVSGIIACTTVDLVIIKGLRWSLFADISIFTTWAIITGIVRFYSKPGIMAALISTAILVMLFIFDLLIPESEWFFAVGLPMTLALLFLIIADVALKKLSGFRGFNLLAVILLSASLYCIISEFIIDRYASGEINVKWSLIVTASILPIALILFFVHYRMKKGEQLDSFFHV